MAARMTGKVMFFNTTKGFGFIRPDDGSPDVFVHLTTVQRAGLERLQENDIVSFEIIKDGRTGKISADNLRI